MKSLLIRLFLFLNLLFFPLFLFGQYENLDVCKFVSAKNGVRVRNSPSLDGEIKKVLPYGELIYIKKRTVEKQTIDGLTDYWYSTNRDSYGSYYDNWIFGGYLSDRLESEPFYGQWDESEEISWTFTYDKYFRTGLKFSGHGGMGDFELKENNKLILIFKDYINEGNELKEISRKEAIIVFINKDKMLLVFKSCTYDLTRNNYTGFY